MPTTIRIARARCAWVTALQHAIAAAVVAVAQFVLLGAAFAHEGHDHDKPAPLNLPIAPRVVAVTPDYELVGVLSGEQRLTIFLHRFETGEPVKDAKLSVSHGDNEIEAVVKDDGVFEAVAPWIGAAEAIDLIFKLTLPDDQDILTGRLEKVAVTTTAGGLAAKSVVEQYQSALVGVGALMAGVLLTMLVSARIARRRQAASGKGPQDQENTSPTEAQTRVKQLRRAPIVLLALPLASVLLLPSQAKSQTTINLPSVPATMATDVPQRMADGSLFVPKATQHLLSIRTVLTTEVRAPRTVQLIGTVIVDPAGFGRVQAARPGRIDVAESGLPHVGKRVEKGELLCYLVPYIEAADKANIESQIAETDARITKLATILSRYNRSPGAMPQVKVDEVEGELEALRRKRAELKPSLVVREEIRAPVGGVISIGNIAVGQIVDGREVLFEIVDPSRFWVEAISHDPGVTANLSTAFAVTTSGERLLLEFAGAGFALKQQAVPLTFRVKETSPNLGIGKPVTVILQSTVETRGLVLPAASVVRAPSGLAIVWVKTEPERFEPHTVRYEALDGHRVVVTAGLKADVRVVTDGATLLNQIR